VITQPQASAPLEESGYRAIFEASSDGLVINDPQTGVILAANPAFCRMHGHADMTGLPPTGFVHPNSLHLFRDYMSTVRSGAEFRTQAQDIRLDGSIIDIEVLGREFVYQGKTALLGVVRDVSEQVRAYELLEQRVADRTREIERRREVAEALGDLMRLVNSKGPLDEILASILEQAARLLASDAEDLYLVDEQDASILRLQASRNIPTTASDATLANGVPWSGLASARQRLVVISDFQQVLAQPFATHRDEQIVERGRYLELVRPGPASRPSTGRQARNQVLADQFRTLLVLPLSARGTSYGALTLYYCAAHVPSEEELDLVSAFGGQAGLAIENARLHDREQRRMRELEALYLADQQLHRSLQLDEVLQALAEVASEILAADTTSVLVWDEGGDRLVLGAGRGLSADEAARMNFSRGEGIIGQVAATGQPRVVDTGIYAPITVGEQVFGVFALNYAMPRTISQDQQRLLLSLAQRAGLAIENARLHGEAQQRLNEVEGLYRADRALHRSLQLSDVLQSLCDLAVDILNADKTAVWTWDRRRHAAVVSASHGVSTEFASQAFTFGHDELHRLQENEFVVVGDVRGAGGLSGQLRDALEREGVRAYVSATIRLEGHAFGTFTVGHTAPRTFTEQERRLVQALAHRAGMAIDNAHLYQESEQRRHEIEALYRADERIYGSLRLDEVLHALVDIASDLLQPDKISIGMLDLESGRVVVGASRGYGSETVAESLSAADAAAMREQLAGGVMAVDDAQADGRLPAGVREANRHAGIHSTLAAPIRVGAEVLGGFGLSYCTSRRFDQDDERLLASLAQRAAAAIQNARLHEESEQRRQELETLYEVDSRLHRSLRLDDVIDALVDSAIALFKADGAGLWTRDAETGAILPMASRGLSPEYLKDTDALNQDADVRSLWWDAELFTIEDIHTDPLLPAPQRDALAREGYRALLSTRVHVGDQDFGSFSVGFRTPHLARETEKRLLSALAQRAGLAIQNARLFEQAQQAATLEERQRLARELHDAVTQTLFSTALIAEVIPELWDANPDEGRRRLVELRRLTRGALAEMRTLLLELRPRALTELPLADLVRQLGDATAGRTRLEVSTTVDGAPHSLPPAVQVTLYRIAQEAFNNIIKHAHAHQAHVELTYAASRVALRITDDGRGFKQDEQAPAGGHLGLRIMRERAETIGAHLQLTSEPEVGTTLEVDWTEQEDSRE
jgi:PAS domain S-box-containing protein